MADSVTHAPLSNASIFDRNGRFIGISRENGAISGASLSDYPITIRYMGFAEKSVYDASADTIFLQENVTELPEVVFESRQNKMLHVLAYVREYSTLSTYTDTVTMFREKMVDFMLTGDKKPRYKGWRYPRVLNSRSYYRFTDSQGTDSVSDRCSYHFTWSDWVGILPAVKMPASIAGKETGNDTISGKYSPTEVWLKNNDKVSVDINVLSDTTSRKWVPNLSSFFTNDKIDFEQFRLRLNYSNIADDLMHPVDLTGYSFNIDSRGRGHGMFRFNRYDEPIFVSTYTEVYILDKEYITIKEAKEWERRKFDSDKIVIYEPINAPELQPHVLALIDRVNGVDDDMVRLSFTPDRRLGSRFVKKDNFSFGRRALSILKNITGISRYKADRNRKRQWNDFRKDQGAKNNRKAIINDTDLPPADH